MFAQTLAIVRNTFFESIRQPVMLVILLAATMGLVLSNSLAGFTMDDDQKMMIDMGLSTVFLCGALLAAFIATNVLNREIENMTAMTVVSKPVSRPVFVLGKFLGVSLAMMLGTLYMSLVFMLVEMHGVLQTVREQVHQPVVLFGTLAGILGVGAGLWCNYFYGKVFSSTVIVLTTPLAGLAYFLALNFDHAFNMQNMALQFKGQMWLGLGGVAMAILVLTAVAIAASTRLGQVMTLCVTIGVFLAGMSSDYVLGRPIEAIEASWLERAKLDGQTEEFQQTSGFEMTSGEIQQTSKPADRPIEGVSLWSKGTSGERIGYAALWVAYAAVPNFQVFMLTDALTQSHVIPGSYVAYIFVYGPMYILVALSLGVILFQRREVG